MGFARVDGRAVVADFEVETAVQNSAMEAA
jgi:hypothetical protein